jgi:hypothetical protein
MFVNLRTAITHSLAGWLPPYAPCGPCSITWRQRRARFGKFRVVPELRLRWQAYRDSPARILCALPDAIGSRVPTHLANQVKPGASAPRLTSCSCTAGRAALTNMRMCRRALWRIITTRMHMLSVIQIAAPQSRTARFVNITGRQVGTVHPRDERTFGRRPKSRCR